MAGRAAAGSGSWRLVKGSSEVSDDIRATPNDIDPIPSGSPYVSGAAGKIASVSPYLSAPRILGKRDAAPILRELRGNG